MRSILFGFLLLSTLALGQEAASHPSPTELFSRVRVHLLADANRMPRYTCLQNITRYFYRASHIDPQSCAKILAKREKRKHDPPVTSWDRLQLDVAIADNLEIHSWPGASKFNEDEIRKLVNNGPFGSGDFRNFMKAVFGGSATVRFARERTVEGRTLFDYTFEVPASLSQYSIELAAKQPIITAYGGSFLLDPQAADLVQLTLRTAELPEATTACQAISETQYSRMDIHGRQVLIPQQTDLRIIYRTGREAVAATSYSSCHEYTSKAVLSFDAPAPVSKSVAPKAVPAGNMPPESPFPAGLSFNIRIVTPIDSDTAAGRPIEAILRTPLRAKDKTVLAKRGARIHGRLVRLADHKSSMDYFEVGVRLESIEQNGSRVPLYAALEDQQLPPIQSLEDRMQQFADFPTAPPRNVGVFFFVREDLRLPQFDSSWITTTPGNEKQDQMVRPAGARKQALEVELKKLVLAINDSHPAEYPNLEEILTLDREAIAVGKAIDSEILNRLYPELGDKFKYDFIEGRSLFIHGWETKSNDDLRQSHILNGEWTEWYDAHREGVRDALQLREANPD